MFIIFPPPIGVTDFGVTLVDTPGTGVVTFFCFSGLGVGTGILPFEDDEVVDMESTTTPSFFRVIFTLSSFSKSGISSSSFIIPIFLYLLSSLSFRRRFNTVLVMVSPSRLSSPLRARPIILDDQPYDKVVKKDLRLRIAFWVP